MNKRYLGAVILSPLVIVLFLGGIYLKLLIILLSALGMYEFYNTVQKKGIKPMVLISYILSVIYYILILNNDVINYEKIFLIITISIFIMLCVPVFNEKYNFIDSGVTLLGFVYISIFFSFIILVSGKEYGRYLVWTIFISSWLGDTSAYYSGKYLGKNKLCPRVSPKKTIEGAIGGLIGSTISCGLYGILITSVGVHIPIYNFFIIGILAGGFSQLGDLVASSIKRYAKVKDYSNLIPGHGGILDRFDSILFAGVVVYYYVTIVMKI